MRRFIPLKFFTWFLLVAVLSVTVNCVHNNAHAMESHLSAAGDRASQAEMSAPHQCPCTPLEQHEDYDGCDTCANCACHAPLTIHQFELRYNPMVLDLSMSDTFTHLPEVFLSKFIPPQNNA